MIALGRQSAAAAHWSRQQYEGAFAAGDSGSPQRFTWVVEENDVRGKTVSDPTPHLLAFLVAHRVDNEWELENIVVGEESRRRGIGTRLLGQFIDHARAQNADAVYLEVRQSNQTARAFYRKLGFVEIGSRKGYYATPPDDAILCRFSFC
jgi:ribosomal-protein-alanine acetyltransferase